MTPLPHLRHRSEKEIAHAVTQLLELHGWKVSNLSQARASQQTPGLPDKYAQHPKWGTLWVEVKGPNGRLSAAQRAWHAAEIAADGTVAVVYAAEDLPRLLARLENGAGTDD